jgi:hypothetical protein
MPKKARPERLVVSPSTSLGINVVESSRRACIRTCRITCGMEFYGMEF